MREEVPLHLQTDKGTEFKNTLFQGQLAEYEIKFYASENDDIKAAIVEIESSWTVIGKLHYRKFYFNALGTIFKKMNACWAL